MVSTKKDSIGAVLSRREGLTEAGGLELVGLRATSPHSPDPGGGAYIGTRRGSGGRE